MAEARHYEPPILIAWLAQHGFVLVLFGPALLVGIFFGGDAAFIAFITYLFTCLFVGTFVAYFRSKKASIIIRPVLKSDWPYKYTWRKLNFFIYTFLTVLNVSFYLYFVHDWPSEWLVFLARLVFFVFIMAHLGLWIAGVMNGDAKVLSEAG